MIQITRINGTTTYINVESILWFESNPDTEITFLNGVKIIIKETIEELMQKINANKTIETQG